MSCTSKEEDVYTPIPYNLEIPTLFADKLIAPVIPANNPLTEEGVALGKKLFFDKVLSGDLAQVAIIHKKHLQTINNLVMELTAFQEQEMQCLYLT
jgi:hypothetical protein